MFMNDLGKEYKDGEVIVRQGESGDSIFVILEGQVEVVLTHIETTRQLAVLGEGDFFGEMEIFDASTRSATVRAKGDARILTVDKTTLMRRLQEDPTLAFHFLEILSTRLRRSNKQEFSTSFVNESKR